NPWNSEHEGHYQLNANREAEQLGSNSVKYPSRMKGVDIEDETWSRGMELSLDRGQGGLDGSRGDSRPWNGWSGSIPCPSYLVVQLFFQDTREGNRRYKSVRGLTNLYQLSNDVVEIDWSEAV
ncbi:hypothetical protein GW17_00059911, partial [Ensete ventricosum]